MRRFQLNRWTDETGVSGTGIVLRGIVFPSGKVVVEWRAPKTSVAIYDSLAMFREIHIEAHPGCGELEWLDEP